MIDCSVADPHQSDMLDPGPHHFADDRPKYMEYEIRIKVKSRIRIRIRIKVTSRIPIQICIKVTSRILIRIDVTDLRYCLIDCNWRYES
jgi:hypothetical protein